MTPRVKLLTLWVGPLPPYVTDFAGRVRDIGIVDWELLLFRDVGQVNRLVMERLGAVCAKESGYALSDVRPMLAEIFPRSVQGYEWWGWVELDTVLGNLDALLPPLLDEYDAISMFPKTASGPLMLLRNSAWCRTLYRAGNWQETLDEPSYCNFEEVAGAHVAGFHKDGGFTKLLRESSKVVGRTGLRVHWDDRFALRDDPAAGCRLDGNRLFETPSGRELLLYHFNHTKKWPVWA